MSRQPKPARLAGGALALGLLLGLPNPVEAAQDNGMDHSARRQGRVITGRIGAVGSGPCFERARNWSRLRAGSTCRPASSASPSIQVKATRASRESFGA